MNDQMVSEAEAAEKLAQSRLQSKKEALSEETFDREIAGIATANDSVQRKTSALRQVTWCLVINTVHVSSRCVAVNVHHKAPQIQSRQPLFPSKERTSFGITYSEQLDKPFAASVQQQLPAERVLARQLTRFKVLKLLSFLSSLETA